MTQILFSVLIALPAFSWARDGSAILADVYVGNTDVHNLRIDQSELGLALTYPGPEISGLCGIEIRADSYGRDKKIQEFLNAIEIRGRFGGYPIFRILNSMTALIDLSSERGGFGVWLSNQTKSGQTLNETISKTLGENRKVVLLGKTCE